MIYFKKFQSPVKNKDNKRLWYPRVVLTQGTISTRRIAQEIAVVGGASRGDVYSVLIDLADVIKNHIADGQKVHLEGIGTFCIRLSASGNGVEKEEDVSAKQFNKMSVRFSPELKVGTMGRRIVNLIGEEVKIVPFEKSKHECPVISDTDQEGKDMVSDSSDEVNAGSEDVTSDAEDDKDIDREDDKNGENPDQGLGF